MSPHPARGHLADDYVEAVLDVVRQIPPGRVMTYGLVAEVVADRVVAAGGTASGGPRQVGTVMARHGGEVPWWRVVTADGRVPAHATARALAALRAEGTPLTTAADDARVRVRVAVWWP